jgi:hypothetical protein
MHGFSRCGVMTFIILPQGNAFDDLIISGARKRENFDEIDYLLRRTYCTRQGSD